MNSNQPELEKVIVSQAVELQRLREENKFLHWANKMLRDEKEFLRKEKRRGKA